VSADRKKDRPVVLVTGISGNLGRTLTKLLHRRERIVGIDRRPFVGAPKDVEVFQIDLRKKKAEDVFRRFEVKAVIHMGIMHDPRMSQEEHTPSTWWAPPASSTPARARG
jgi:UDP-glucose 4-epimerase